MPKLLAFLGLPCTAWILFEFLNINPLSVNKHNLLDCKRNNGQNRSLIDQASDCNGMSPLDKLR